MPELCIDELRQRYGGLVSTRRTTLSTAITPNPMQHVMQVQPETPPTTISPLNRPDSSFFLPRSPPMTATTAALARPAAPVQEETMNVTTGAPSLPATATLQFMSSEYSEDAENLIDDLESSVFTDKQQPNTVIKQGNISHVVVTNIGPTSAEELLSNTAKVQSVGNPEGLISTNELLPTDQQQVSAQLQLQPEQGLAQTDQHLVPVSRQMQPTEQELTPNDHHLSPINLQVNEKVVPVHRQMEILEQKLIPREHHLVPVNQKVISMHQQPSPVDQQLESVKEPSPPMRTTSIKFPISVANFFLTQNRSKAITRNEYNATANLTTSKVADPFRTTATTSPAKPSFVKGTTALPFQINQEVLSNDFTVDPSRATTVTQIMPSSTRSNPHFSTFVSLLQHQFVSTTELPISTTAHGTVRTMPTETKTTIAITTSSMTPTATTTTPKAQATPATTLRTITPTATTPITVLTTPLSTHSTTPITVAVPTKLMLTESKSITSATVMPTTSSTIISSSTTVLSAPITMPSTSAITSTTTTITSAITKTMQIMAYPPGTQPSDFLFNLPDNGSSESSATATNNLAVLNETLPFHKKVIIYLRDRHGRLRPLEAEASELPATPPITVFMMHTRNDMSVPSVMDQTTQSTVIELPFIPNTSLYGSSSNTDADSEDAVDESQSYEQLSTEEFAYGRLVPEPPSTAQAPSTSVHLHMFPNTTPTNFMTAEVPNDFSNPIDILSPYEEQVATTIPAKNESIIISAVSNKHKPMISPMVLQGYEPVVVTAAPQQYGQVVSAVEQTYSHIIAVAPQPYVDTHVPNIGAQRTPNFHVYERVRGETVPGYGHGFITENDHFRNNVESPTPLAISSSPLPPTVGSPGYGDYIQTTVNKNAVGGKEIFNHHDYGAAKKNISKEYSQAQFVTCEDKHEVPIHTNFI